MMGGGCTQVNGGVYFSSNVPQIEISDIRNERKLV